MHPFRSKSVIQGPIWVKVFKNGPNKICGRQPLKNLKWYGLLRQTISDMLCSGRLYHKFYLVHSWIPWPIWCLEAWVYFHSFGFKCDDLINTRTLLSPNVDNKMLKPDDEVWLKCEYQLKKKTISREKMSQFIKKIFFEKLVWSFQTLNSTFYG